MSAAVGAGCVFATVFYLAKQIRNNTQAIEGSTEQMLMNLEKEVYALIVDNAGVYRRGSSNISELDPDESIQFQYIIASEMSLIYSAYVQYQRQLISYEVWDAYKIDTSERFAKPGYLAMRDVLKPAYPSSFVGEIEKLQK